MKLKKLLVLTCSALIMNACSSTNDVYTSIKNDQDQDTVTNITDSYRYQLPVIFHVFYMNQAEKDTLSSERISFILKNVNNIWKGGIYNTSPDMCVDFVLAQKDDQGNTLSTPGIEYIKWTGDSIDVNKFMNDQTGVYKKYIWDPNDYINIMMFPFKQEANSSTTTLGISDLPYTTNDHELDGLTVSKYTTLTLNNLKYAYCSAINSTFAGSNYDSWRYTLSHKYSDWNINSSIYDISVTIAHEMGHYLGLHHNFTENANGDMADSCADTDYCEDTPSYNRIEYEDTLGHEVAKMIIANGGGLSITNFHTLVKRANCSNANFDSHNLMDYSFSNCDNFTDDQRTRIRHVLYYSPLIPGPKKTSSTSNAKTRAADGPVDLPIRTAK
jgi:zinc-dependent metalloproteinase lipoprotein